MYKMAINNLKYFDFYEVVKVQKPDTQMNKIMINKWIVNRWINEYILKFQIFYMCAAHISTFIYHSGETLEVERLLVSLVNPTIINPKT